MLLMKIIRLQMVKVFLFLRKMRIVSILLLAGIHRVSKALGLSYRRTSLLFVAIGKTTNFKEMESFSGLPVMCKKAKWRVVNSMANQLRLIEMEQCTRVLGRMIY